jgi:hypothetical protein
MSKVAGVRLSDEEYADIEVEASQRGVTVSDVIRNMLYASKSLKDVKDEIRLALAQKTGDGGLNDTAEIKRIVTLIARAMPAVAKYV